MNRQLLLNATALQRDAFYNDIIDVGNPIDSSSAAIGANEFNQLNDPTQFLTPNDLISQRSSPDFMQGGITAL